MQWAAGGAKQCALVARGKSMPRAGILIDFMSTHIDFLLILRLGEKCAGYLKLPDTRMPDERDFTVLKNTEFQCHGHFTEKKLK